MSLALPALAESVIRRGNGGEPQSLDQAQISIDIDGFIIRDLSEGLTVYDAKGKVIPARPKAGPSQKTARSIPSRSVTRPSGRMVRR